MSVEKVELEIGNKKHACTGHVMCCEETGRTIASFWHEGDAADVTSKVNSYDKLVKMLESVVTMQKRHYGNGMTTHIKLMGIADNITELLNEINNRG